MINARLNEIMQDDDELFNRIKAYGPGDGINRVSVAVEDATSISTYGLRETTETFLDATSRSDLETKATEFLNEKKDPVTQVSFTLFLNESYAIGEALFSDEVVTFDGETVYFYDAGDGEYPDIVRGDTIRIVSQELNLNTTGVVQEIDWEPGQVTLTIGKGNYSLLDVINGPREDAERQRAALGLPTPIGFSAQRISPGIRVFINPYANSRAVGVEIYAGPTAGFEPDQSYLLVRGAGTTFDFTNLTSGDVYYFKARSYDGQGNYSDVAGPVSAIAGYLPGSRVEGGTLDLDKFVSDTRPIKIVTSLPVVASASDPDYKVGMLVNYYDAVTSPNGALYRLISTTGVPSTDWVRAIDTESIADDAITADQILANTITANEIDAGSISTAILITDAIKANMIEAGAVTASKITVDGEVVVSNSAQTSGAFSVKNASNAEVLRLGDISAKSVGANYGLWGALGTGVFIEGAVKVVHVGNATVSITPPTSLTTGAIWQPTAVSTSILGSFTVPSGKEWVPVLVISTFDGFVGDARLVPVNIGGTFVRNGSFVMRGGSAIPAGSYTSLAVRVGTIQYVAIGDNSIPGGENYIVNVDWFIYELDA